MFSICFSTLFDLSNFNTNNINNISYMFNACSSLTFLDLSNFNTIIIIYMSYMFLGCFSLTLLDLSNFDVNNKKGIFLYLNKYCIFFSIKYVKQIF